MIFLGAVAAAHKLRRFATRTSNSISNSILAPPLHNFNTHAQSCIRSAHSLGSGHPSNIPFPPILRYAPRGP